MIRNYRLNFFTLCPNTTNIALNTHLLNETLLTAARSFISCLGVKSEISPKLAPGKGRCKTQEKPAWYDIFSSLKMISWWAVLVGSDRSGGNTCGRCGQLTVLSAGQHCRPQPPRTPVALLLSPRHLHTPTPGGRKVGVGISQQKLAEEKCMKFFFLTVQWRVSDNSHILGFFWCKLAVFSQTNFLFRRENVVE